MKKGNFQSINHAIEQADNIFIFHHIRPDGDCLGAQFGLATLIRLNFKNKKVYCVGKHNNLFSFLNLQHDDHTKIPKTMFKNSLALIVDVSDISRIELADWLQTQPFTKLARIDHHIIEKLTIKYNYHWLDSTYASACEMIGDLARQLKWKINAIAANYLYLGIYTDTGRFNYQAVDKRTFAVMTYLHDAKNFSTWNNNYYLSKRNENELKYMAHVINNYIKDKQVIWYYVSEKIIQKYNLTYEQASYVNLLANIGDAKIWVFFIQYNKDSIRVRIRSNSVEINKVAEKFNGGGHEFAAGAFINDKKEIPIVIKELQKLL